ncbi:MarR family transcriptional regulator [Gordonia sp. LSe1-13]|uniref:MarR family transcriptional regulator n=1 Tax=Gordonia sesuvii TaxID=3116777 RepID=A0ABU7MJS2_9ACTN|nr:MarR family transcriptional regulator [Gordonia sp. LSe1-13]
MLDQNALDELFDVLARYVRMRDRAAHRTFRTPDGDVESAAFKCLFHLARQPMRARELAESLHAEPSSVSRYVAELVDLGFVRREADPADGRATLLVITDIGRERVAAMRAVRRHAMDRAMTDWTDDELRTLVLLLGRFVDAAEPLFAPSGDKPGSLEDLMKGRA